MFGQVLLKLPAVARRRLALRWPGSSGPHSRRRPDSPAAFPDSPTGRGIGAPRLMPFNHLLSVAKQVEASLLVKRSAITIFSIGKSIRRSRPSLGKGGGDQKAQPKAGRHGPLANRAGPKDRVINGPLWQILPPKSQLLPVRCSPHGTKTIPSALETPTISLYRWSDVHAPAAWTHQRPS
jgi:hypothetical protein